MKTSFERQFEKLIIRHLAFMRNILMNTPTRQERAYQVSFGSNATQLLSTWGRSSVQRMKLLFITQTQLIQIRSHQFIAKKGVDLIDEVSYTNLTVGAEYTVTGKLMDKASGKALVDGEGKEITASTTFTAKVANGAVKVKFHFDASDLGDKTLVVFEDLYRNNIKLATHADINDAAQSVTVGTVPKTGDNSNIGIYVVVCCISVAGLIGVESYLKRKSRKSSK